MALGFAFGVSVKWLLRINCLLGRVNRSGPAAGGLRLSSEETTSIKTKKKHRHDPDLNAVGKFFDEAYRCRSLFRPFFLIAAFEAKHDVGSRILVVK